MSDIFDHEGDAWDSLGSDRFHGEMAEDYRRSSPRCRKCGHTCDWHHTGVRWALMDDNGRLHNCATASPDEFAVLPDFDLNDPAQGLG